MHNESVKRDLECGTPAAATVAGRGCSLLGPLGSRIMQVGCGCSGPGSSTFVLYVL